MRLVLSLEEEDEDEVFLVMFVDLLIEDGACILLRMAGCLEVVAELAAALVRNCSILQQMGREDEQASRGT
jgi:hypothetical protein